MPIESFCGAYIPEYEMKTMNRGKKTSLHEYYTAQMRFWRTSGGYDLREIMCPVALVMDATLEASVWKDGVSRK